MFVPPSTSQSILAGENPAPTSIHLPSPEMDSPSSLSTLQQSAPPPLLFQIGYRILSWIVTAVNRVISWAWPALPSSNNPVPPAYYPPSPPPTPPPIDSPPNAFIDFMYKQSEGPSPELTLREPKAHTKLAEIFSILGHGEVLRDWLPQKATLERLKEELKMMNLHPFAQLFILVSTPEMVKQIIHFLDKAKDPSWFNPVYMLGMARTFYEDLGKEFDRQPATLTEKLLPGLCEVLNLPEDKIKNYLTEKKWEKAIDLILDIRRKHFNV